MSGPCHIFFRIFFRKGKSPADAGLPVLRGSVLHGSIVQEEFVFLTGEPLGQLVRQQSVSVDTVCNIVFVLGYFSIDKKGKWTDTAENNQGNRDNAERAYNLIMKDKEKLLSKETKLKCVFHPKSATHNDQNPPPITMQSRPPIPIAKPPHVTIKARQSGGC